MGWVRTALILLACTASAAPALGLDISYKQLPPASDAGQARYEQQVRAVAEKARDGDFKSLGPELDAVVADPRFARLAARQRAGMLLLAGFAASENGQGGRARDLLEHSVSIEATGHAYYMLTALALAEENGEQAGRDLMRGLQTDASQIDDFSTRLVPETLRLIDKEAPIRVETLQALLDADWNQRGVGASDVWLELALLRLQEGELARAKEAIRRIDGAMAMTQLRADRRFDAVLAELGDMPLPETLARQRASRLQALQEQRPDSLEVVNERMGALLLLGDWDAVIALSDDVRARLAATGPEARVYADLDEQEHWSQEQRSLALLNLGRTDEAVADLKAAAAREYLGHANVNQVLDLGIMYCQLGRPADALAAIAAVGEMSGYGKMVQASVQLRAAALQQDRRAMDRALAYLREHREDGESILLDSLVAAGRVDDAAAELIVQLRTPSTRADALLSVQDFRESEPLPGQVAYRQTWREVMARTDVQAAIQREGRIQRIDIYSGWGHQ